MGTVQRRNGRVTTRSRLRMLAPLPALAVAAVLVLGACGSAAGPGPGHVAGGIASPLPVPSSATIEIGFDAPGMEGGVPFVEYRSAEAPAEARANYDGDLRTAGFELVETRAGWTVYGRDDLVLWVSVSESGPPTTIIVRYAQGEGAATILATAPAGAGSTPGVTGRPDGSPGPSATPIVTAANPATPEPVTRPGGPFATPPGQVNKPTAKPTADPPGKPTAKPTREPRPTKTPKPTKSPKPTPPTPPGNGGGKGNKP